MVSLVNNKFVTDIASWELVHPKSCVKLYFRRKINGDKYFTCSPPPQSGNKHLFISSEDLLNVIDIVNTWIEAKFISSSVTNEWGVKITGGEITDTKRLTLVFTQHNNIESIDIRSWWRSNPSGIFRPSPIDFNIVGRSNIIAFVKMREEILKRLAEEDILDNYINTAHGILYRVYKENYMFNAQCASVMDVVNVENFTYLWDEEIKLPVYKDQDLKLSARDIYTYVITEGLPSLEKYIDCTQFLLSPFTDDEV